MPSISSILGVAFCGALPPAVVASLAALDRLPVPPLSFREGDFSIVATIAALAGGVAGYLVPPFTGFFSTYYRRAILLLVVGLVTVVDYKWYTSILDSGWTPGVVLLNENLSMVLFGVFYLAVSYFLVRSLLYLADALRRRQPRT